MRGACCCAPTGAPPCFPTLGGYGGQPMDRRASRIPDRAPDFVARDHIGVAQHLLYRLTGDTNLVHVDRAVAERRGLQGPFVHDLCAFGYACRLAIGQCFPGQPERLRRMYGAMKTVLYPDTPVELHLWQTGPGQGAFRPGGRRHRPGHPGPGGAGLDLIRFTRNRPPACAGGRFCRGGNYTFSWIFPG